MMGPEPNEAQHPVISIAYLSSKHKVFHVWGLGDFSPEQARERLKDEYKDYLIQYRKCEDEHDLLTKWLIFWENNTTLMLLQVGIFVCLISHILLIELKTS